jgi:signal transduction histidine kinase
MLALSDTGTGMPPDVAERAFEPFFSGQSLAEKTGLGLSMVYGFAKQSGGTVTLESVEGRGTTVRLYLPRAQTADGAPEAPTA